MAVKVEVPYDTADNIVNTVLGHDMAVTWYGFIEQFMVMYILMYKYTVCWFYMHNQNWNTELEELCNLLL